MPVVKTRFGLTGNQLKIIAMISMTLDHIGGYLLPQWHFLRILGRLAMPIYAYMIAEGCYYTHSRRDYFLRLAGLALVCQLVYWFAQKSLYQCILVTFSLSVGLISLIDKAQQEKTPGAMLAAVVMLIGTHFICEWLPQFVPGFSVDYGFFGVLLPVIVYFGGRDIRAFALGLVILCLSLGGAQWWCLATVPLLALYNGQRGKARLGWLFYLYFPAHLVVIYAIGVFL